MFEADEKVDNGNIYKKVKIELKGTELSKEELILVKSVAKNSAHPLSVAIFQNIELNDDEGSIYNGFLVLK